MPKIISKLIVLIDYAVGNNENKPKSVDIMYTVNNLYQKLREFVIIADYFSHHLADFAFRRALHQRFRISVNEFARIK